MKPIISILVALFIAAGYLSINSHTELQAPHGLFQVDDGPGTGNDGEDTSDRGLICRVFGVFC